MRIRKGRNAKVLSWIMMVMFVLCAGTAWALPGGGAVVSGSDAPVVDGRTMTINQTAPKSIINWESYSIDRRETVAYTGQGSANWISLNRVTGADPSQILGQITADGAVWVINPNGLLIGSSARINVGSFLGSTLSITDDEFNDSAPYTFTDGANSITNQGKITTTENGYVALLAPSITNKGTITTPKGQTLIASGNAVTLDVPWGGTNAITIDAETAGDALGIVNSGKIIADGGLIYLAADSGSDPLKTVINNTCVIQARTISNVSVGGVGPPPPPYKTGYIYLLGNANNSLGNSNTINVGGTLDASAPNGGDGGWIETSAARVMVANSANVTTNAPKGATGWWSIDPVGDFNIGAASGAGEGGSITGSKLGSTLGKTNVEIQTFHPGSINVNQPVSWSSNNTLQLRTDEYINVNKNITASGKSARLDLKNDDGSWPDGFPDGPGDGAPVYFLQLNNGSVITLSGAEAQLQINKDEYTVINSANVRFLDFQFNAPDLAGNYALGTNINASVTSGWNDGAGVMPVGTESDPFTGNFNGLGHTISNLTINQPDGNGVGLFGYNSGLITNIGLTGGSVTGLAHVGALAGFNDGYIFNAYATTAVQGHVDVGGLVGENTSENWIVNSYATGKVTGIKDDGGYGGHYIGGLVGDNDGFIFDSYAKGAVSGYNYIGGLVGINNGPIDYSYATGAVSGTYYAGGLVGENNSVIADSYATGKVSGVSFVFPDGDEAFSEDVGGLVGRNHDKVVDSYATGAVTGYEDVGGLVGDNEGGVVEDSHATGKVSAVEYVGGLVGWNDGMIEDSYATGKVTGNYEVGGLVGENDEGMITRSHATGAVTGVTYVYPEDGEYDSANIGGLVGWNESMIDSSYATGKVSGYEDVGGLVGENNEGMITKSYATGAVKGTYDVGGLVGGNYDAMITESFATGAVTGDENVGGLVGGNYGQGPGEDAAIIEKSYATGAVKGSYDVGGLVGENYGGKIEKSYATGNVAGGDYAGGLVGWNGYDDDSLIVQSYATGNVKGSYAVGGLAGGNEGWISNTDAWSNVTGKEAVGGLVGFNDNDGLIENSYSIGTVSGSKSVGGFLGHNNNGVIISSYWDMTTSGKIIGVGGSNGVNPMEVTGLNTPAMMQESSFDGWDFDNVWSIDEGVTYPLVGVLAP